MIQPRHSWSGIAWLVLALLFFTASGKSFASLYTPQVYSKHGAVYARSLVQDESGHYIYVEYDESGEQVPGGLFQVDDLDTPLKYQVYSGNQYRAFVTRYEELLTSFELNEQDAPELVERKTFEEGGYTTYTGDPANPGEPIPVSELTLRDDTVMVAIAPEKSRYSNDPEQLLLMEFPINPEEPISDDIRSLLIKRNEAEYTATVVHPSEYNIGYLTGFFGESTNVSTSWRRDRNDKIYGPLSGVPVRIFVGSGAGFTDEQGKYGFQYSLPPCPGFTFDYTTPAYVELYYKRFNPQASSTLSYFLVKYDWDFCNGLAANPPSLTLDGLMTQISVASSISKDAVKPHIDFPVDFMVLSGRAALSSGSGDIPLGQTLYDGSGGIQDETLERIAQKEYDLDGDGESDYTELGRQETDAEGNKLFVKTKEGETPEIQGVWLSGQSDAPTFVTDETTGKVVAETFPNITRLPDWSADFTHRALLSEISKEDLGDTDIYVFRESDGSLLMERKGLDENDMQFGVDEDSGKFFYTIRIVGSRGRLRSSGAVNDSVFENWQISEGVVTDSPLYKREADHLRPGERVRLISINRASGYLGSDSVELKAASDGSDDLEISFHIDDLQLLPPNLRVWAERQSKTELGMTKDELNTYLVGSEGAGMSDDEFIVIYTEWLDPHGMPLPTELEDYGYTARLARIVAENELGAVGSVDDVAIKPGKQMSLIRLPEVGGGVGNEHYYIQVSGQPNNRESDFSSGSQDGMLKYRPKKFVPVLVPVYDEDSTNLSIQTWNSARETDSTLKRPEPIYKWFYRPEYQFSVYDLKMREINRENVLGETENILQLEQPVIASSDEAIQLLYDLTGPSAGDQQLDTLDAYSYGENKELVFAFGDQELSATVGADGQIVFDDVSQLSSLTAEDYLTIRLYTNNDPENVLWEWAFEYLAIDTLEDVDELQDEEGVIRLSADNPELHLQAVLIGYAQLAPEYKEAKTLRWFVEGSGAVNPATQTDKELGVFNTTLTMPNSANSEAVIKAELIGAGGETSEITFGKVIVVPGVPANISIQKEGEVSASGSGRLTASAQIKDAWGNNVMDGTAVVMSVTGGADQNEISTVTSGGLVQTVIAGGEFSSTDNLITVRAGEASKQMPFEVHPLQLSIVSIDPARIGTVTPVSIKVTDYAGSAVDGVQIEVSSSYGIVQEESLLSDDSGMVTAHLVNPPNPGSATLTVRAGFSALLQKDYDVVLPSNTTRTANTRKAMVVGDAQLGDTLLHERYDLTTFNVDYPLSAEIPLSGQAGTSVELVLGDMADPNLPPIVSYPLSSLENDVDGLLVSADDGGKHPAYTQNSLLVQDHPLGAGRSLEFVKEDLLKGITASLFTVAQLAEFERASGTGFRLEIKPTEGSGEILNYGGGAHSLRLDPMGRIVYSINTTTDSYSVTSDILPLNQWHRVAGRYLNGQLELYVNGKIHSTSATGDLQYTANATLTLGGFAGRLTSLRLYDWSKQPLLDIAGHTDKVVIALNGSGQGTAMVTSLGHMNDQYADSALSMLRIALIAGVERQYVSMVSSELYVDIAGYYIDNIATDTPPINMAAIENPRHYADSLQVLDYFISPAMAWDFSFTDVGNWIKEAVTWLVPFNDIEMLSRQLFYFATSNPEFDPVQLTLAALGTLTAFPVAKPLRLFIRPLQRMVHILKPHGKFVSSLGSAMGNLVKKAWDSKSFKVVYDALPFLLIVGELVLDAEARDGLILIAKSVVSDDDLWAWIDYLRLPADGWLGEELPELELLALRDGDDGFNPLDGLIGTAYAASGKGKRIDKAKLVKLLRAINKLDNGTGDFRVLIDGIKGVTGALKKTDLAALRKTAFSKETVVAAMAVGQQAMRRLYRRATNLRISPLTIAAIITYIESRKGTCPQDDLICVAFPLKLVENIDRVYKQALTKELLSSSKEYIYGSKENGGFFHLAMLAVKQLQFEALNDSGARPLRVEETQKIQLYSKQNGVLKPFGTAYERRTDIVLAGKTKGDVPDKESWLVEVKSLKGPINRKYYQRWDLGRGKLSAVVGETVVADVRNTMWMHRQFFLDRVAVVPKELMLSVPDYIQVADDFQWWYQKFKRARTNTSSYTEKDLDAAVSYLGDLPTNRSVGKASLGGANIKTGLRSRAQLFSIKNWILAEGRRLLGDVADDTIKELIEDEAYDLTPSP